MRCRKLIGVLQHRAAVEQDVAAVGSYSRFSVRSNVDLPDPDGPITAAVVPAGTSISTPRNTAFGPTAR